MVIGPGQISFSIVLIKIDKYFYMLFTCCCNFPPIIFIDFMVIIFDGLIRCRRFRVGVEEAGERGGRCPEPHAWARARAPPGPASWCSIRCP